MEQLGALPSADVVLNKLKSDGTFDQFRKTCLASIEAEPSFRAYGEHIEVVARRYLTNFRWRDNTTKNNVRGRLKDHALGVIAGPDIQVGMPLSSLVDKVLESKAKELLPKISEVVEKLRETKNKHLPSIQDTPTSSGKTAEKNVQEVHVGSKAKPTDFGSLPLPIDIPGLISSTTGNIGSPITKKEPSEGKPVTKSKAKASESYIAKDNKTKVKSSQQKLPTATKESLKKEKELVSEKEATNEDGMKEREKYKSTANQKKTKDEVKDKGTGLHKDKSQDSKQGCVEKEKVEQESQPSKSDKIGKSLPISHQEQQHDSKKYSSTADSEVQGDSKKVLPTRRRSARLASLTESVEDSQKEEGDSDEYHKVEEKSLDKETVYKSVNEGLAKTKSSSSLTKRKRKRMMKSESQKKRQRLLSTSSDEQELASSEEESDYGSLTDDTRKITEESRKSIAKAKSKQTENTAQNANSLKKSRKRVLQQSSHEETSSIAQKKSRRLSKSSKDNPTTEALPSTQPLQVESVQKPHRRKSSQPHRLPVRQSKSPPPVVVTRYNRQIKPNRRYFDPSGEQGEAGSEDETGEAKMSTQYRKDTEAYSDIDSSD